MRSLTKHAKWAFNRLVFVTKEYLILLTLFHDVLRPRCRKVRINDISKIGLISGELHHPVQDMRQLLNNHKPYYQIDYTETRAIN